MCKNPSKRRRKLVTPKGDELRFDRCARTLANVVVLSDIFFATKKHGSKRAVVERPTWKGGTG
jgi:hypothetical protein